MAVVGGANDTEDAEHAAIRVALVAALPLMRDALRGVLADAEEIGVIGEATTAEDALGFVRAQRVDVVVIVTEGSARPYERHRGSAFDPGRRTRSAGCRHLVGRRPGVRDPGLRFRRPRIRAR
ncbi:MAG TPA: hypothetical protein VFL61_01905 [Gaiellaceae bacterium]|nr:hypothetical protein [Gaiellaceae bacterium]